MAFPLIPLAIAAAAAGLFAVTRKKHVKRVYSVAVASSKSAPEVAQYLSSLPGTSAVIGVTKMPTGSWNATVITTNVPTTGGNADFNVTAATALPADPDALLKQATGN